MLRVLLHGLASVLVLATQLACKSSPQLPSFRAAAGSPHALGRGATHVVLADFDRDGALDAVTASAEQGELHSLRGDGRGGFATSSVILRVPSMHAVVAADFDADGDLDLVASGHDSREVTILLGSGDGRFTPAAGSPFATRAERGEPHNHGLLVADFDGNGTLDVLTSDQNEDAIALLLGDGRAGFAIASGSPWAIGRDPYPPAAGDLDGDGDLDVVSPAVGAGALAVLLGDGHGGFVPAAAEPAKLRPRPYSLALGDLDGDGRLDAVVAHDDLTIATVLLGDGAGGFASPRELELGGRGYDLGLVDVDANGTLDLLAASAPSGIALLLGDGHGAFAIADASPLPAGAGTSAIATGDLDSDGRVDLVAANFESNDLSVLLQQ